MWAMRARLAMVPASLYAGKKMDRLGFRGFTRQGLPRAARRKRDRSTPASAGSRKPSPEREDQGRGRGQPGPGQEPARAVAQRDLVRSGGEHDPELRVVHAQDGGGTV